MLCICKIDCISVCRPHIRPQQSGFTPGRATCDRIVTLNNIAQRRQDYMDIQPMQPMLICVLPLIHSADPRFGYC